MSQESCEHNELYDKLEGPELRNASAYSSQVAGIFGPRHPIVVTGFKLQRVRKKLYYFSLVNTFEKINI